MRLPCGYWSALLWLGSIVSSRGDAFPIPYNSEPDTNSLPQSPALAAAGFQVPSGFTVHVFAAEPDVQNPIACAWDGRGRLWVAENYTYAERAKKFDLGLRDRILIFEDATGSGHFSSRKVFTDDLQRLTSIEVGAGGVWALCPPQLLFIPDPYGGDRPVVPPEVVLDGFSIPADNYHNFANGLRWGPDGWLYGRCGASAPGDIGSPNTPKDRRIPLRGTMWRYHPLKRVFEALSGGTTNPWGHDWNELGELFFINTVNGHLWHEIPGAHYVRPHTLDPNPHVYGLIDQHADHWHFDTAQGWTKSRGGAANSLGGGHAHVGMMIYQGDNWPEEYRGHLFTWNMHGRRANQEILERSGSGYVGHHGNDILLASDPWFRGMELSSGPDGGVFALDWSDTGECHDSTGVHRTSGRIYKIVNGANPLPSLSRNADLTRFDGAGLVNLQGSVNEWWARQARVELAARAQADQNLDAEKSALCERVANEKSSVVTRLRSLWTLHAIGGTDDAYLLRLFGSKEESVRTWAIRLLSDGWPLDTVLSQRPYPGIEPSIPDSVLQEFLRLGRTDPSGLVRLTLASTLQRLPVARRAALAGLLAAHAEDANDHNLPLMVWYGLIPVGERDPGALVEVAAVAEWPLIRRFIARRMGEEIESHPAPLNALLNLAVQKKSEAFSSDIVSGLSEALRGWRKVRPPAAWESFQQQFAGISNSGTREQLRDLGVLFGSGRALEEVRAVVLDRNAELSSRQAALRTLIESRPPDLRQICEGLLGVRYLNAVAVRGLAQFDDPSIGQSLAKNYLNFSSAERGAVLDTLVSRKSFAGALLDQMAAGTIPHPDLTPFHARQIRSLQDPALTRRLTEVWGEIREPSADKQQAIARFKEQLNPAALKLAEPGRGRVVFNTTCAPCHTLFGQGGQIGPDLTGAGRDNMDYLLENIVEPSAVVNADFRMSIVELKDGRTINGIISARTERTLTLKSMNETLTVDRSDIQSLQESNLSIMPEGILESLQPTEVRDLIGYLMSPAQVALVEK